MSQIRKLGDASLANSRFFLELLASIDPEAVDWSVVAAGTNAEEKLLNAKYTISVARRVSV